MQAKTIRRAKKNKPAQETTATEPEVEPAAPDASTDQTPPEPADNIPAPTSDPPAGDIAGSSLYPDPPSLAKVINPEVDILKTQFVPPGQPSALAKCSAKTDLLEHQKRKLDSTDFAHLSIGEIVSGYVYQAQSSRDLEINMVKQIQQKSEVKLKSPLLVHTYCTSPQVCCL